MGPPATVSSGVAPPATTSSSAAPPATVSSDVAHSAVIAPAAVSSGVVPPAIVSSAFVPQVSVSMDLGMVSSSTRWRNRYKASLNQNRQLKQLLIAHGIPIPPALFPIP